MNVKQKRQAEVYIVQRDSASRIKGFSQPRLIKSILQVFWLQKTLRIIQKQLLTKFLLWSADTEMSRLAADSVAHTSQVVSSLSFPAVAHMKGACETFQTHESHSSWAVYKTLHVWWRRGIWKELVWQTVAEPKEKKHGCCSIRECRQGVGYEVRLHGALWVDGQIPLCLT